MSAVLVIGEPNAAQERATELRMMGYPTWTATNEADLRWLLDQAWIRPAMAVVDLRRAPANDRGKTVAMLSSLATSARLPALLIGADDAEARMFPDVVASLPSNVDVHTLIRRIHAED